MAVRCQLPDARLFDLPKSPPRLYLAYPFPQNGAILLTMAVPDYLLLVHKRNGRSMVYSQGAQNRFVHRLRFRKYFCWSSVF